MAYCKTCGALMPDNADKCPICGAQNNRTSFFGGASGGSGSTTAFMGTGHTDEYDPNDISANKMMCVFAYIPFLFWLPLVAAGNLAYGRFHANQGLLLLFLSLAIGAIGGIFGAMAFLPGLGILMSVLGSILSSLGGLAGLVLMILGMINTYNGRAAELPIIGKISIIK